MKKWLTFFVASASLLALASPLLAHHGRGATYDADKEITLTGTVTELAWRNPHVAIYMDVKDANGKVVNWAFESSNVSTMSREGWSRNVLKPGQIITVTFNPSRAGAAIGIVRKVVLADGKVIRSQGNANTLD
jgi:Family of unknown function (DUF6152)